jgi:hypothetical protein
MVFILDYLFSLFAAVVVKLILLETPKELVFKGVFWAGVNFLFTEIIEVFALYKEAPFLLDSGS